VEFDAALVDVRFGSKGDIGAMLIYVRFTPKKRTFVRATVMSALCQKQTFRTFLDEK
jgi:hypothetical protein